MSKYPVIRPRVRTRVLASTAISASLVVLSGASAVATDEENMLVNGDFSEDDTGWNAYPEADYGEGQACVDVKADTKEYGAGFIQKVAIEEGERYTLSFDAMSTPANTGNVRMIVQGGEELGYVPFSTAERVKLSTDGDSHVQEFVADRDYAEAEVVIQQDVVNDAPYRMCVSNVRLVSESSGGVGGSAQTGGSEGGAEETVTGPEVQTDSPVQRVVGFSGIAMLVASALLVCAAASATVNSRTARHRR